jgi:hypothetical protein
MIPSNHGTTAVETAKEANDNPEPDLPQTSTAGVRNGD